MKAKVKLGDIELPDEPQHGVLPARLVERITEVAEVLAEVIERSPAEWADGFRHDAHPEREVKVWEWIARAYPRCIKLSYTLEEKRDVFGLLLGATMGATRGELLGRCKRLDRETARGILERTASPDPN